MTTSWMPLLWFGLIVALIPAALWLVKRSGMGGALVRAQGLGMRQIGALVVGPQQRVVAIEVGEGEGRRWLLLGVTPQQVNTLQVLDRWPGASSADGAIVAGGMPSGGSASVTSAGGFATELAQRVRAGWAGAPAQPAELRLGAAPGVPARGDHVL